MPIEDREVSDSLLERFIEKSERREDWDLSSVMSPSSRFSRGEGQARRSVKKYLKWTRTSSNP